MRRAGGHDNGLAGKRFRRDIQQRFNRGDDLQWLSHAPGTRLAAFGHLAAVRPDKADAVIGKGRSVAPCCGMIPHSRVHGRCNQDGLVGRQEYRRGEIIGQTTRHFCHEIRRCRSNDNEIRFTRQADMPDIVLVLTGEQVGKDLVRGQCTDGQGRDKFFRCLGQHRAHMRTPLTQAADQIETFIGGNAAADDEKNMPPRKRSGSQP